MKSLLITLLLSASCVASPIVLQGSCGESSWEVHVRIGNPGYIHHFVDDTRTYSTGGDLIHSNFLNDGHAWIAEDLAATIGVVFLDTEPIPHPQLFQTDWPYDSITALVPACGPGGWQAASWGTYQIGDSNTDGVSDSSDLLQAMQSAKYETGEIADWFQGNWNDDVVFDTEDLILLMRSGLYEQPPAAVSVVPEPCAIFLLTVGLLFVRRPGGN